MTKALIQIFQTVGRATLGVQISLLMLLMLCGMAIFGPLVSPYGETKIVGSAYAQWSSEFVLGTDAIGRDILSRLIYGARNTIGIAFIGTALAFLIGTTLGVSSVLAGGWVDQLLGRIFDMLIAIPQLIMALLVLAIVGTSVETLIGVIAVVDSTRVYRVARAATLSVAVQDFVESARVRGESMRTILFGEVLPNVTLPLFTEFGVRFSSVFLFISSLSFLGLGVQPPFADWGSMVKEYAPLLAFGEITPLIPAVTIAALTISVNVVVDWALRLHTAGFGR
jgi:peptide/nickel transport system permease protein